MIRKLALILLLAPAAFAGWFGATYTLRAGAALPLGENRDHMSDGFGLNAAAYKPLNRHVLLGLQAGYDRWSLILNPMVRDIAEGSLSYTHVLLTGRVKKTIKEDFDALGQLGTGFFWGSASLSFDDGDLSVADYDFGLKAGAGLRYGLFEFLVTYNNVFVYGERIHWAGLTLGVCY